MPLCISLLDLFCIPIFPFSSSSHVGLPSGPSYWSHIVSWSSCDFVLSFFSWKRIFASACFRILARVIVGGHRYGILAILCFPTSVREAWSFSSCIFVGSRIVYFSRCFRWASWSMKSTNCPTSSPVSRVSFFAWYWKRLPWSSCSCRGYFHVLIPNLACTISWRMVLSNTDSEFLFRQQFILMFGSCWSSVQSPAVSFPNSQLHAMELIWIWFLNHSSL